MLHNAKLSEMLLIQRGNLVAVDIYRIAEKIEPENSVKKDNIEYSSGTHLVLLLLEREKILRRDVDVFPNTNRLKGSEYNCNKIKLF